MIPSRHIPHASRLHTRHLIAAAVLLLASYNFALAGQSKSITVERKGQVAQIATEPAIAEDVVLLAEQLDAAVQRRQIAPLAADPSIASIGAAALNQVAFEVSKDGNSVGKARLAVPVDPRMAIDVVLKGALNAAGAGTPFTHANGLADGASVEVGIHRTLWTRTRSLEIKAPGAVDAMSDVSRVLVNDREAKPFERLAYAVITGPQKTQIAGLSAAGPGGAEFTVEEARLSAEDLVRRGAASGEHALFVDASYGRNAQTFEYLQGADLAATKVSEDGHEFGVSVGYGVTRRFGPADVVQPVFYAAGSFTGGRSFTGSPKQQICLPIQGTVATRCSSIALAAPARETTKEWKVEGRAWLRNQKIGLNPEFVRDQAAKVSSIALNVSALVFKAGPDGSAGYELDTTALTAGARFGWVFHGEAKGPAVSVFFATALGLW